MANRTTTAGQIIVAEVDSFQILSSETFEGAPCAERSYPAWMNSPDPVCDQVCAAVSLKKGRLMVAHPNGLVHLEQEVAHHGSIVGYHGPIVGHPG